MPEIFLRSKQKKLAPDKTLAAKKRNGVLSSFLIRPAGVTFETQEEEEEIILLLRRHIITNFVWVLFTIILVLIPGIALPAIMLSGILPPERVAGYYIVMPLLWYLGVFGYAFSNFLNWYYNVYIVTNKRIVDIDWRGLLYKEFASGSLEKIQDVSYKQGGIIDSFFNYGTVFIQTAGTEPNLEFELVASPDEVVKEINQIIEENAKLNK